VTIGSLFSGIGGLDLAMEWAGFGPTVFQVEIDPWCRAVLAKHWPQAERYDDVRELSGAALPLADVWCGGFPCQDISGANPHGRGLDGERSGLWFEFRRLLEEARDAGKQPRGVVVENVGRLARRGLDVVADGLCGLGYEVEVSRVLAADVGAPHLRERCFLVCVLADAGRAGRDEPGRHGGASGSGEAAARGGGAAGVGDAPGQRLARTRSVLDSGRLAAADGAGEGRELADSASGGSVPVQQPGSGRLAVPGGEGAATPMGDPDRARHPLVPPGGVGDEQPPADGAGRSGDGARPGAAPEPRVGVCPDGLPWWVAGPGPGGEWPAPRGAAQRPWEAPRTIAKCDDRPRKLKALGNAVCPQQGFVAALRLRERLGVLR
jgi:DNA (cytosine-5)-methyltransferase 1